MWAQHVVWSSSTPKGRSHNNIWRYTCNILVATTAERKAERREIILDEKTVFMGGRMSIFLMCHDGVSLSQWDRLLRLILSHPLSVSLSLHVLFSSPPLFTTQSNPQESICCSTPFPPPHYVLYSLSVWSTSTPCGSSHTSICVGVWPHMHTPFTTCIKASTFYRQHWHLAAETRTSQLPSSLALSQGWQPAIDVSL